MSFCCEVLATLVSMSKVLIFELYYCVISLPIRRGSQYDLITTRSFYLPETRFRAKILNDFYIRMSSIFNIDRNNQSIWD